MKAIEKKTKEKDLTLKQRKWLDIYLKTGNATEAAMRVYKCKTREYAAQIGHENLRKLDYSDFMEAAGISDHLLQQKIMEGLNANKVVSAQIIVKKDTPSSLAKDGSLPLATSRTNDFVEVEDYAVRHKYLETALKLKKRLSDKKEDDPTQGNVTIVGFKFVFPAKPTDE